MSKLDDALFGIKRSPPPPFGVFEPDDLFGV